jgi:Ca2+-binding EF-hand superfamily protein
MITILTFNEFKRLFCIYTIGRSKISYDEAYELFDDLNCLYELTKSEFTELCKQFDEDKNQLMDANELYEIYKKQIEKNKWD